MICKLCASRKPCAAVAHFFQVIEGRKFVCERHACGRVSIRTGAMLVVRDDVEELRQGVANWIRTTTELRRAAVANAVPEPQPEPA